jgi:hypothetical protein
MMVLTMAAFAVRFIGSLAAVVSALTMTTAFSTLPLRTFWTARHLRMAFRYVLAVTHPVVNFTRSKSTRIAQQKNFINVRENETQSVIAGTLPHLKQHNILYRFCVWIDNHNCPPVYPLLKMIFSSFAELMYNSKYVISRQSPPTIMSRYNADVPSMFAFPVTVCPLEC